MTLKFVKADWNGLTQTRQKKNMTEKAALQHIMGKGWLSRATLAKAVKNNFVTSIGKKYLDFVVMFL